VDLRILKDVNGLWSKIYPYLAVRVMKYYGRGSGEVLELGSFSGGISIELARLYPGLNITIAAQEKGVVDYLQKEIEEARLNRKVEVRGSALDSLGFADGLFDLVIFRGAYFFLDEEGRMLREIYRVLKEDGLAFVGGGYGKDTPQALIDEIAEESRDLNDRLGRKRVTEEEVKKTGREYKVGSFPFMASGRARAMEAPAGFAKVIAAKDDDEILGVHIIGPMAGELIAEAVLALEYSASAEDLQRTIHAHPTLSEALHEAALSADKRAIDVPNR